MSKHKHAEMIKAKAENMELVVFIKHPDHEWKQIAGMPTAEDLDYFLCLPENNENSQCLHWLNGGSLMVTYPNEAEREFLGDHRTVAVSGVMGRFLNKNIKFSIKPKKVKRWIAIRNEMLCSTWLFKSEIDARLVCGTGEQFIEIEVEV